MRSELDTCGTLVYVVDADGDDDGKKSKLPIKVHVGYASWEI